MKKYYISFLFIIIMLFLTGCESKLSDSTSNNKNENTQFTDDDSKIDEIQSGDDTTNNTGENGGNQSNSNSNDISSNTGNNNSSNNLNDGNNNTNNNSGSLDKIETNDNVKIVDATVTYSCDTMFDYKLENDKCIRTEIVTGLSTTYSCPNGYVYNSGKCYIKKAPNQIKYCENSLAIMEGDFCVEGQSYEALTDGSYGWPPTFNPNGGGPKKIYKEETYTNTAQINCPENSTVKTDTNTQKSYCLDNSGNLVSPLKVTCPRKTETVKSENNNYYCVGIHYKYHYCWGEGTRLIGTICTPGKPVNWGMYCDDDSQVINGYCQYATEVQPVAVVNCPGNSQQIPGSDKLCSYDWIINAIVTYNCPSGYVLNDGYKCKLNS